MRLKTKRLLLEEHTIALYRNLLQAGRAEIKDFYGLDEEAAIDYRISRMKKHLAFRPKNWRKWTILHLEASELLGFCVLHQWDKDQRKAEIGYDLVPSARGKGYMQEALRAVFKLAFGKMEIQRLEAIIHPKNTPSIKVVSSLGFEREGLLRKYYHYKGQRMDCYIYSLLEDDWKLRSESGSGN